MKHHFLATLGLVVLAACAPVTAPVPTESGSMASAAVSAPTTETGGDDIITYETKAPLVLETYDIEFPYAEEALRDLFKDCGRTLAPEHVTAVVTAFSETNGFAYVFTPAVPSDGKSGYVVTAFPNDARYGTFDEFKNDFDLCFAGGNFYPMAVNEDYILFQNSCGSGAGEPTDCDRAKEALGGSVQLKRAIL